MKNQFIVRSRDKKMKKRFRKTYEKPRVTKVRLEAKVSVLAVCKNTWVAAGANITAPCNDPTDCSEISS